MSEMLALEAASPFESMLTVIPPPPPDDEIDQFQPALSPDEIPSDTNIPKAPETKTLVDLAHEVATWTLHSDHDLHSYLKRYSADLFTRTKNLEDSVRDIAAEADSAHVRLKNTFNEFLMLSNNQFIENRVYDEEQEDFFSVEDGQSNTDKQEIDKEKEEQAGESATVLETKENGAKSAAESIVTKYRSALDMGMEAMKLFVMIDDEDDKSETSSQFDTVLDIYNERPLPFIIGTREFLEDETLGLGAAPEDYSDSDSDSSYVSSYSSSNSGSDSENESENSGGKSRSASRNRSSSNESEHSFTTAQPRRRASSDESDTSGLFGRTPSTRTSRRRVDSDESSTSGLFGRPSVSESAITPASRQRPEFNEDESDDSDWTSDSDDDKKMSKRKQSSANREAPPPFAASTPARKKYLESSDEESDAGLFGSAPSTKSRVFATDMVDRPPHSGGDQMADSRRSSKLPSTRRSNSFNSSSSDDSELFGKSKEASKTDTHAAPQGFRLPSMGDTKTRQSNILKSNNYSSSDSDVESTTSGLFGRPASASKTTRKPSGESELPPAQRSRRLDFSDDSSDDETVGLFQSTPSKATTPKAMHTTVVPPQRPTYSDSSSDDEDEGLFGAKPKSSATTLPQPVSSSRSQPVQRASQSGLFTEDDSDESGSVTSTPASTPATMPYNQTSRPPPLVKHDSSDSDSDSDSDGGLFGQSKPARSAPDPIPKASMTATSALTRQSRAESDSSDSDESDLFGASAVRTTPAPISTPTITTSPAPAKLMTSRRSLSDEDSDDWSDDDGGLFGVAASKSTTAKPATVRSTSTPPQPENTSTSVVHPPISSTATRMQIADSDSDSDSDSDWDGDGGLFGPSKTK